MHYHFHSTVASIVLPLIFLGIARGNDAAITDDEPKAVALAFAIAFDTGDADGMARVVVDGAKNAKAVAAIVRVHAASTRLQKAAAERFGVAGADVAGFYEPGDRLTKNVAASSALINADRAEIPNPQGEVIRLRKVSGHWRVDLGAMFTAGAPAPILAQISDELTSEIATGKYASPKEVLDAMRARLLKAGPIAIGIGDEGQRQAAREIAVEFTTDLLKGDAKSATKLSIAGPTEEQVIAKMAAMLAAYGRMGDAAVVRFGAAGKVLSAESLPIIEQISEGPINIKEDAATFVGARSPLQLKRSGNKWMMDLKASNVKEELTRMSAAMAPMQAVCDEMTGEIGAGKYKSPEEAMAAMRDKLTAGHNPQPATSPETVPKK